eukprot:gene5580-11239_t
MFISVTKVTANEVASAVIRLFSVLRLKIPDDEYTVLSGIVASIDGYGLHTLSIATGTKCFPVDDKSFGIELADSHAEILARRGLVRFLMKSILNCLHNPKYEQSVFCPVEFSSGSNKMRMKSSWRLWLYISDSPCGDASIFGKASGGNSFTGAKPVLQSKSQSDDRTRGSWIREDEQVLGVLRTKSGRSDLKQEHRSSSHCCSDKICRWQALGIQGALLSHVLTTVYLHTVVVSRDPNATTATASATKDRDKDEQLGALARALSGRMSAASSRSSSPSLELYLTDETFRFSKSTPLRRDSGNNNDDDVVGNSCGGVIETSIEERVSADTTPPLSSPLSLSLGPHSFSTITTATATAPTDNSKERRKRKRATQKSVGSGNGSNSGSGDIIVSRGRPWGNSVNWIVDVCTEEGSRDPVEACHGRLRICEGGTLEVTQALTGLLLGVNKAKRGAAPGKPAATCGESEGTVTQDDRSSSSPGPWPCSRLSRRAMGELFADIIRICMHPNGRQLHMLSPMDVINAVKEEGGEGDDGRRGDDGDRDGDGDPLPTLTRGSYGWWKAASVDYVAARSTFLRQPLFRNWICSHIGDTGRYMLSMNIDLPLSEASFDRPSSFSPRSSHSHDRYFLRIVSSSDIYNSSNLERYLQAMTPAVERVETNKYYTVNKVA